VRGGGFVRKKKVANGGRRFSPFAKGKLKVLATREGGTGAAPPQGGKVD